ncbi:MAG TPA: mechanosensitive ion channel, partial [Flavobacteriales bacterium]|nr:mechanosensitive ion channel [Flavobacteriales bacterium]
LTHLTDRVIHAFDAHLGVLLDALPGLLSGLLVLLVGWLIARVLRWTAARLLKRVGLDAAAEKAGLDRQLQRFGGLKLSKLIGLVVYWAVLLVFLLAAADVMGLDTVTRGIEGFLAYLPTLLSALAIFVIGLVFAEKVKQGMSTLMSSVGIGGGKVVAQVLFGLVALFMTITALNVAGIDTTLITSNILIVIGGVLIAFGIAYGLAARGILTNILSSYYGRDRIKPGQRIRIGQDEGVVERIDSIAITLDTGDRKVMLPCSLLTTERIEVLGEEPM